MNLTEKDFLNQVREVARLYGWMCYHTYDSRRSEPGFPDLVLVREGRLIFAELKTDTGKLTPAQDQWYGALRDVYGIGVYIWQPRDWDEIVEMLA